MWINYQESIREGVADLVQAERAARGTRGADRVKLLRLLKSGQQRSMAAAAVQLGYSSRQAERWWRRYRRGGLEAMLAQRKRRVRERVPSDVLSALEEEMAKGSIARLLDAQAWLDNKGVSYTLSGLCRLFQRHRIKRKTGRLRHLQADAAAQAAFKKGAARHPA